MIVPMIATKSVPDEDSPGYHAGVALDELVSIILESGCSESELRERFDEALDRADGEGA